jgi:hypothetical protein
MKSVISMERPSVGISGSKGRVYFSLVLRTLLFFGFGLLFVGVFWLKGAENPLQTAEKWWPFQAILANISTFFILRGFVKKEGKEYRSLFHIQKRGWKKNTFETFWLLLVGFGLGGIPLYLFSYLLLGSFTPPDNMMQPIPMVAAVIAVLLFPITNALVETPTYIGYALPRLKEHTGKLWIAICLAGFALALQHVALPIVLGVPYMMWRILAFLPLALALGVIFTKTKRLVPIVIVHYIMDLQMVLFVLLASIS